MSDFSSGEVLVPGLNQLFIAEVGAAFPTDIDTPVGVDWVNMGYFDPDGLKVSFERKSENVMADQSFDPLRVIITEVPKTIALNLLQWNSETLRLGMGGGEVTSLGGGKFEYEPPEESFVDERAAIISMTDGERDYRICYRKVMNQAKLDMTFVRSKASMLPLELGVLAADDGEKPFLLQTNDPRVHRCQLMAGVDITYADGSTVTAEVRPVHLILAERQFGDRIASHRIEATLYAAWRALGSPEGGFDAWLATIHEFDEVTRIAADPTGGEPLADASPT